MAAIVVTVVFLLPLKGPVILGIEAPGVPERVIIWLAALILFARPASDTPRRST